MSQYDNYCIVLSHLSVVYTCAYCIIRWFSVVVYNVIINTTENGLVNGNGVCYYAYNRHIQRLWIADALNFNIVIFLTVTKAQSIINIV